MIYHTELRVETTSEAGRQSFQETRRLISASPGEKGFLAVVLREEGTEGVHPRDTKKTKKPRGLNGGVILVSSE